MNLSRMLAAAALSAGLAVAVSGQTPPATPAKPGDTPAAPKADTPKADAPKTDAPGSAAAPAPNPDVQKAVEELQKGDFEKAMKFLKDASEKDKKLPPPLVLLAQILFQSNNAQQGRGALERAGAEDPGHPDPYIFSAAIALNEGRVMDAMLLFEKALTLAGDARWNVDLRQRFVRTCREGLAQCYANRNEFARALVQLKNILDDEPKNAVVRWQAARLTFLFGQHELALEELKKCYADDPKNPQIGLPEVNMAKFWEGKPIAATEAAVIKTEQAANTAKSEEWMKKAVEAYKTDVRANREYGRWLMNHARLDEADKLLAAAKAIAPDDDETNAFIGLSHRYKKQYKEAAEVFRKLESANRANLAYGWNYALSLAESADEKDRVQAISIANNIAQGNQKNPEAFAVLAWCLFKNSRLDDADAAMGQAIRLSGGRLPPDNIFYLAKILAARSKKVEARDRLKVAIESKDAFVFRKDAEELHAALLKEFPEEKKPEDKKP